MTLLCKILPSHFMSTPSVSVLQFEEVQSFMVHLENLIHLRDQLYQKEREAQEKVDQLRKTLQRLEGQHHLLRLHMNNQLSQLHNELKKICSEALTWVPHRKHGLKPSFRAQAQMLLKNERLRLDCLKKTISCMTFSCPCLSLSYRKSSGTTLWKQRQRKHSYW